MANVIHIPGVKLTIKNVGINKLSSVMSIKMKLPVKRIIEYVDNNNVTLLIKENLYPIFLLNLKDFLSEIE
jgi:hypothetical protein